MKLFGLLLALFGLPFLSFTQKLEILTTSSQASLRGLSVVDDRIVWVSGSGGTVGRSTDAGKTWTWSMVKGFEKNDFRDIEAFDSMHAVVLGIGEPGYLLRTNDGGRNWKTVFEDRTKGIFLDAMEFGADRKGIVIGDPIGGSIYTLSTGDGGNSWKKQTPSQLKVDPGEAMFAASGTNIRLLGKDTFIVTGGSRSRCFVNGKASLLPLLQGRESTGANSIAVLEEDPSDSIPPLLIVVGGDFSNDTITKGNCVISVDKGESWFPPNTLPGGYRSCVEFIDKNLVITCGLNGVDLSIDQGLNWKPVSKEGFHVCRKAKKGNAVFLAGGRGRIARLGLE